MTPITSLQQRTNTAQNQFFALCAKYGVILRTFQGDSILDAFSIVHDQQPYIVLNTTLPISKQNDVIYRELAVLRLSLLSDGKSSLFLSDADRKKAESFVKYQSNEVVEQLSLFDGKAVV